MSYAFYSIQQRNQQHLNPQPKGLSVMLLTSFHWLVLETKVNISYKLSNFLDNLTLFKSHYLDESSNFQNHTVNLTTQLTTCLY